MKSGDRFLIFWTILGGVGFILIWNLPWRFQVNDDVIMMWLVSGAYTGQPESYAVFLHPILSWVFSGLYIWCPEFNWYGAIWFWVTSLSYFLLVYVISGWKSDPWLKGCFALFLLYTAFHFCFFPQFTLVSGFAAFAALSFWFTGERGKSLSLSTLCIAIFILGILIRWESVALISLGFGTFQLINRGFTFFTTDSKKSLVLIHLLALGIGTKSYWEAKSEYVDFLKFNKIRSGVIDHPIFQQQIIESQFSPGTDFYFFSRWYFEAEHPTEEELVEKKKELDSNFLSFQQLGNSFKRVWRFQKMEAFKSFLILCILLLFLSSIKKFPFLLGFFLIWTLFFILFNHFFLIQGRVVILFFLCFLFPALLGYHPTLGPNVLKSAIFVSLILFCLHGRNFLNEAKGRAIMDQEFNHMKSLVKSGTPLIFEGYQEHNSGIRYTAKKPVPFLTTGWISRSPFQKKALERFGLKNFGEIKEYALLTPSINLEIVFPSYMDHTFGDFQLKDSIQTDNFILLYYLKN